MFNNTITNLEKKALIMTLAYLSPTTTIKSFTSVYHKKLYNKIKIDNLANQPAFEFNVDNYFKCDEILKKMLIQVFDEYNFVPLEMSTQVDILHNFSLLCNGISQLLKEQTYHIFTIEENSHFLANQLQNISDKCTLKIISNHKLSSQEKTCLVIVRHLIDNIISGQFFSDGIELLDFINGTRIIKDLLCLNATLYDENEYFRFYQESN